MIETVNLLFINHDFATTYDTTGSNESFAPLLTDPMSPVRRTFCLLTLFDLGLSFLLWILYTQIVGMTPIEALKHEVVQYNIHFSLFDLVLLAAVRFIFLILAYGLFRLNNPWMVAVTTTLSSGFLIAKVFLYTFAQRGDRDSPILDYLLLVSSFVISWAETWFLDFKVLPREIKERLEELKRAAADSTPLLYGGSLRYDFNDTGGSNSAYYSPVHGGSPENRSLAGDRANNVGGSVLNSDERNALIERARGTMAVIKELRQRQDWKLEKQGKCGCNVFSLVDKKYGKICKLDAELNASSDQVFADFYHKVNDGPNWNPSLRFSERIDVLNDHTDVTYVCIKDQAGGMITSRDYVDVRCFEVEETNLGNKYIIVGTACDHPKKPPTKEFVRGVNGPNAWINEPLPPSADGQKRCKFTCYCNTNIKGWIPQTAVDNALSTVLLEMIRHLQKKYQPNLPECTP